MKYYETLYIVHPALDSGRIKEIVISTNKTLEKNNGTVASLDVWGKKKLAYEIDKQKYGTYVLLQFKGDGSGNSTLNMELEHNPNILAYLTVSIDESKLKDQSLSLDEQLRGDQPTKPSEPVVKNDIPNDKSSDDTAEVEVSSDDSTEAEVSSDDTTEAEVSSDDMIEDETMEDKEQDVEVK